jgi:hypothetical protein
MARRGSVSSAPKPPGGAALLGENVDKNCPICFGIGWVCENHPGNKELGCECGAGMPCKCNDGDELDTSQVIVEEDKISRH